jgi:hypothetical protein
MNMKTTEADQVLLVMPSGIFHLGNLCKTASFGVKMFRIYFEIYFVQQRFLNG